MPGRIGITLGDVTGIGPEVTLKALASPAADPATQFVLIGDAACLQAVQDRLGLHLPLVETATGRPTARFVVDNPLAEPLPPDLPPGDARAARAAVRWLEYAAHLCLTGTLDALVTAPVNKYAITRAGIPFVGHTEWLSQLAGTDQTVMMLLGHDAQARWLRVALATVHVALRDVPAQLTAAKIRLAIQRAAEACVALGLERARVAVCGLNPHCGEGGNFGDEEPRLIEPALRDAREQGLDAVGPLSGDTVFYHALQGEYDAVVAMYHDQGLAPLKAVAFDTGVNWTVGLPFIRTSPDHGTAYDLAGQNRANPSSMAAAIRLAVQLVARRATV